MNSEIDNMKQQISNFEKMELKAKELQIDLEK